MEGYSWRGKKAFRTLWDEYLYKVWLKRFGLTKINSQGFFVLDNNYSEGWNLKALIDLGIGNTFWSFTWELKRYMEVIAVKYDGFKEKGFQRKRSAQRIARCTALKAIWDKFDTLDRTQESVVWQYLQCLFLCWENEYDEVHKVLNSL